MIRRELAIFLVVGTLTVLVDFLIYRGLVWTQLCSVDLAKGVGFLTGTVFAYFANRFWTFGHKVHAAGSAWRFIFVYSLTLAVNVLVNSSLIAWLPSNMPALLNELITANKYISTNDTIYHEIIILSQILNKASIQVAFLVATVTSATLNFIGMKLFVFKVTPVLD